MIICKNGQVIFMNEEYKQYDTVADSEVIEIATKLMDEFDEAFKELAK